jgi:hypothetical protein
MITKRNDVVEAALNYYDETAEQDEPALLSAMPILAFPCGVG